MQNQGITLRAFLTVCGLQRHRRHHVSRHACVEPEDFVARRHGVDPEFSRNFLEAAESVSTYPAASNTRNASLRVQPWLEVT